ncbi:MAG: bifunctional isocitrate dehydrogenase kinase/phosphatase [Rhodocyclaceae bacterium]|nr:bifunctional isocitrate dehydrogenase kinase/phosphatase [Rhodocyclaceae bacterium]MBX3667079.1 bifunctional isocitrate dehydrogenase kinase/phosphatase [Rhodocyclaceae bacterium]
MENPLGPHPVAHAIAQALIEGFDKHYRLFRQTSGEAKLRFEAADWPGQQKAVKERIRFYDARVRECAERLHTEFHADSLDDNTWQQTKLLYMGRLVNHKQPECAETFFNSVTTKILHRTYFNNDFIFVRPAVSTEYIGADPPTYRSYYPNDVGLRRAIRQIFVEFRWKCSFANLDKDVVHVMRALRDHFKGVWPEVEANCHIQVLGSAFYRNKAAYVIGKGVNGHLEIPFVIPVLHNRVGRLLLDSILLDVGLISMLFSLSRAYFMVDMDVPSAYVQFLRTLMPAKPRSELYTMIGLGKQGKTMFYRDLLHHLHHSADNFVEAPGIRGLVMHVFMLPSYPYVFKIIKDKFGLSKDTDRDTVKSKFVMVKQVDRVGRMADTLEFSELALPRKRFSRALLDSLFELAPSIVEEDGDDLIIKHCYIERRMIPLNMYLESASETQIDQIVCEYGNAIRQLALANIFPGDLLWKNFGVTRFGRVVFYDYDEIEYLTDCNFRRIPPAPYPDMELSGEVWYSVARNDVFPEEFGTFLLANPKVRKAFMKHHADLLRPEFWQRTQERIRCGSLEDFYPYPEELRFTRRYRCDRQAVAGAPLAGD